MRGLEKTCLEMCAVESADVYSPALTENAMLVGLDCNVEDRRVHRSQRGRISIMGAKPTGVRRKRESSQHDHISYLLHVSVLARCIVVTTTTSNIDQTRLHDKSSAFKSPLHSKRFPN